MADVYEKDLEAKSSLTSSDYIRVVGSDNVSYKQPMNSVLNVFNLVFSSASDMDAKLANLPQSHAYTFFSGNNEVLTIFGTGSSSVRGIVVKPTSTLADFTLWTGVNPTKMYTFRMTLSTHAITSFTEWPTRAEVDALNTKTSTTSLTPASGVNNRTCTVYKVGKLLLFDLRYDITTAKVNGDVIFSDLPTGFRPANTVYGNILSSAGNSMVIAVNANGTITVGGTGGVVSSYYYGQLVAISAS